MRLYLLLLLLLLAAPCAQAAVTPTEAQALAAARQDRTTYTLPPGKLAKAITYDHQRLWLTAGDFVWGIAQLVLLLTLGYAARMNALAIHVSKFRWLQSLAFLLLFLTVTTVLQLPLDMIRQHLALSYGMSVQHWTSWFGDQGKSFLVSLLIGWPLQMLFFWIVRRSPRLWWFWFWIPAIAIVFFGVFLAPLVLDPLFNTFEPLEASNPALVEQLERVVQHGGIVIPPDRMYLMKASDKVTTLNAYVTGLGASKRVVVWDTSISQGTPDEIAVIFGHEMGHYVLGHVLSTILFLDALLLVLFYLGSLLVRGLLRRYGIAWGIPSQNDWAFLVPFLLVLTGLSFFSEPIINAYSRAQEHQADVYGQEAVHGIVADPQRAAQDAFQLLGENGLSNPYPGRLEQFWLYSHPPIGLRAAFAAHYNPWAPGQEPKYFKR